MSHQRPNTSRINKMVCTFLCLIKVLRVLILDHDDDLQDQNRFVEGAYLNNDQILALLTALVCTFLSLIKALRVVSLDLDFQDYIHLGEGGVSNQRPNTSLININRYAFPYV